MLKAPYSTPATICFFWFLLSGVTHAEPLERPWLKALPMHSNPALKDGEKSAVDKTIHTLERYQKSGVGRDKMMKELVDLEAFHGFFAAKSALFAVCRNFDDSQDVEHYRGVRPPKSFIDEEQQSIGQIEWNKDFGSKFVDSFFKRGEAHCSGVFFAHGDRQLFLTAGHCFDKDVRNPRRKIENGPPVPLNPDELAGLMHVNFNFQKDGSKPIDDANAVRPADPYPIIKLWEHRGPKNLDYAIVELGPNSAGDMPKKKYTPNKIDASHETLSKAELLTIIQHPDGKPKRVDVGFRVINPNGSGTFIHYDDLDTTGGASGSPILNEGGNVIGVHTNGGCFNDRGANQGVALAAVKDHSQFID